MLARETPATISLSYESASQTTTALYGRRGFGEAGEIEAGELAASQELTRRLKRRRGGPARAAN